jgi:hypothetical protein
MKRAQENNLVVFNSLKWFLVVPCKDEFARQARPFKIPSAMVSSLNLLKDRIC